jgi:hypothetical protein
MDVWTYVDQKEREYHDRSFTLDRAPEEFFQAEEGADGRRGRVFGNLILIEEPFGAYLRVSERVAVVAKHIRRLEYGYFLIIDGEESFGYERDPSHRRAEHGHITGHERVPAGRMTFAETADLARNDVSERVGRLLP